MEPPPPELPSAIDSSVSKKSLRTSRIIWTGLLIGDFVGLGWIYLTSSHRYPTAASAMVVAGVVLLVAVVPCTFMIRAYVFKRNRVDGTLAPPAWLRGNLIFWAGCEAVWMFGAIVVVRREMFWPTSLVMAATLVLQIGTFPRISQTKPLTGRRGGIGGRAQIAIAIIGIVGVAIYSIWTITKAPPEWATHPLGEAIATQPSQFLPPDARVNDYLRQLHSVAGDHSGVEIKLYGMQKGVPREDGWVTMISTGAGFSIAMPGPSIDMRLTLKTTDGVAATTDTVESDMDGMKLRAVCIRRTDGRLLGGIESILASFQAHPDKADVHEIMIDGKRIYDVRSVSAKGLMRMRLLEANGGIWTWGAEYSAADEKDLSPQVIRYLDSFRLPQRQ